MSTTTPAAGTGPKPAGGPPGSRAAPPKVGLSPLETAMRLVLSGLLLGVYFTFRDQVLGVLRQALGSLIGPQMPPAVPAVAAVTLLGALLVAVWWKLVKADPRFHAPILITYILAVGDAQYGILDNLHSELLSQLTGGLASEYSPTFVAIIASVIAELALGRFMYGKWPHLASAYISGISVGILVKSTDLWPYVMCALISIVSKYALRVRGQHLWNPSNFGITVLLWLGGERLSSLSVQSGNDFWPVLLIWALGGLILYKLRRLHIPLTFLAAFIPLALFRSWLLGQTINWAFPIPGQEWLRIPVSPQLAVMTWPMFQLYIFFMITDPRTTTKARWSQCAVALLVAVLDSILQLSRDVHSLYHALFIVAPLTNLMQLVWDGRRATAKQRAAATIVPAPALATPAAGRSA
jgi:hypothetical protein